MNLDALPVPQSAHDTLQISIETTGLAGSVAVLRGENVIRDNKLDSGVRTAAALAPVLAETLQWCRQNDAIPQFISVADGPGSFTGLRIGVTTAKTYSYAVKLPLISVDSLAAMAAVSFWEQPKINDILVGINAYRGQVFMGRFQRDSLLIPVRTITDSAASNSPPAASAVRRWSCHPAQVQVLDGPQWSRILQDLDPDVPVTGDRKVFRSCPDQEFVQRRMADAAGVGLLAVRASMLGLWSDPIALVPRYLRPSAAEEKADRGLDPLKPQSA
jgi:tRNA threonylcarbamoyl adenosine modification protein YeaZ